MFSSFHTCCDTCCWVVPNFLKQTCLSHFFFDNDQLCNGELQRNANGKKLLRHSQTCSSQYKGLIETPLRLMHHRTHSVSKLLLCIAHKNDEPKRKMHLFSTHSYSSTMHFTKTSHSPKHKHISTPKGSATKRRKLPWRDQQPGRNQPPGRSEPLGPCWWQQ